MAQDARSLPQYPQFEKLFEPAQTEAALRRIERTRKQLSGIAEHPASPAERDRARHAFHAYTLALNLVREVADMRQKLAAEPATPAAGAR